MNTALNQIRDESPCADGWKKLLAHLGKTQADDEALSIITILDSNGLDDALWCLRAVTGHDREIRLYAVWCARQVQHLLTDRRSLDALDVAERFANGLATDKERAAARAAAWDAARAAAWAAATRAAEIDAAIAQQNKEKHMTEEDEYAELGKLYTKNLAAAMRKTLDDACNKFPAYKEMTPPEQEFIKVMVAANLGGHYGGFNNKETNT